MQKSIYIALLFISSALLGQGSLDKTISVDVCNCLSQSKNLSEELFSDCFQAAFQKNNELIIQECLSLYKDTSEQTGRRLGREIYDRISVNMIYSCNLYYFIMDSLRYSAFQGVNKDSIKNVILNMSNTDSKDWNEDFFTQRGVMYFQLSDLDNALKDFDNAIKLNQYAMQSLYFKAWSLELKKNYDEAFTIYSNLALLTKKNYFNIFAAIAKQKKNGL